jgi:hypothetical protein
MLIHRKKCSNFKLLAKIERNEANFFFENYQGHIRIWFRPKKFKIISCLCTLKETESWDFNIKIFKNQFLPTRSLIITYSYLPFFHRLSRCISANFGTIINQPKRENNQNWTILRRYPPKRNVERGGAQETVNPYFSLFYKLYFKVNNVMYVYNEHLWTAL